MRYVHLTTTDPTFNLAAEEWLLRQSGSDVFMLWRNAPSIIVGRNQNAHAQINEAFVRERGIPVVRRLTGGGAVFHDLGNVNFTFIRTDGAASRLDFERFTRPIAAALETLGVACHLDGRNDLVVDGRKISGNAQVMVGDRILHHGTLLFAASLTDMSRALLIDPLKYRDKAVKSVASRVANISEFLSAPLSVEAFIRRIFEVIARDNVGDVGLTHGERAAIDMLADRKYRVYDWNFGRSPAYAFSKSVRTAGGMLETHFDVRRGRIAAVHLYGEYFNRRDVGLLEALLVGCPHERAALLQRLEGVSLEDYMAGIDAATLVDSFF